jgi:hypothetical protein
VLARLARVFLVVALLAGWQAALLHPLQHADAGGLVHLGGKPSDKSAACDVLAALAVCAPQAQLAFDIPVPGRESPVSSKTEWRLAQPPPFLAQGPPSFL